MNPYSIILHPQHNQNSFIKLTESELEVSPVLSEILQQIKSKKDNSYENHFTVNYDMTALDNLKKYLTEVKRSPEIEMEIGCSEYAMFTFTLNDKQLDYIKAVGAFDIKNIFTLAKLSQSLKIKSLSNLTAAALAFLVNYGKDALKGQGANAMNKDELKSLFETE